MRKIPGTNYSIVVDREGRVACTSLDDNDFYTTIARNDTEDTWEGYETLADAPFFSERAILISWGGNQDCTGEYRGSITYNDERCDTTFLSLENYVVRVITYGYTTERDYNILSEPDVMVVFND